MDESLNVNCRYSLAGWADLILKAFLKPGTLLSGMKMIFDRNFLRKRRNLETNNKKRFSISPIL